MQPRNARVVKNGDFVRYDHEDRTNDGLDKDTPDRRGVESRPCAEAKVIAFSRLGGLHHR